MWVKPSAWNSSIVVHMLFGEKVGGLTVCKKREPIDPSFLEKVVERRRQIQDASCKLLKILDHKPEGDDSKIATYSFEPRSRWWRAAFLLDATRDAKLISEDARGFLDIVVSENAVTFSTERRFANWVVGYCLNNAKHRLNQPMGSEELLEND